MVLVALLFLATVLGPILFWLWFFIYQDRAEPEPKKLLIRAFLLGVAVNIFSVAVEGTFFRLLFPVQAKQIFEGGIVEALSTYSLSMAAMLIMAGLIEELLKYFVLREFIYYKSDFNQVADGVFYAVTLALGFSFLENIFYFFQLYLIGNTPVFVISSLLRGLSTPLLHATATGLVGYALGRMKFTKEHKRSILAKYLVLAILVHALFNSVVLAPYGIVVAFPLLLLVFFYLIQRLKKSEAKLVWKLVKPGQGSPPPA